jgi:hypothetical protein
MAWEKHKSPNKPLTTSIDGYTRTPEVEKKLNQLVATVFKGDDGRQLLSYLKSITMEAVAGPNITQNELFHLEGKRYLVAILIQRINQYNNEVKK